MIKALTVYLVYYELKSATINDSINQFLGALLLGLVLGLFVVGVIFQMTFRKL